MNPSVVQDFLLISDEFGTSRSPLYVVLDGDVISEEGREEECGTNNHVTTG